MIGQWGQLKTGWAAGLKMWSAEQKSSTGEVPSEMDNREETNLKQTPVYISVPQGEHLSTMMHV